MILFCDVLIGAFVGVLSIYLVRYTYFRSLLKDLTGNYYYVSDQNNKRTMYVQFKNDKRLFWRKATLEDIDKITEYNYMK